MRIIDDVVIHPPTVNAYPCPPGILINNFFVFAKGQIVCRLAYRAREVSFTLDPKLHGARRQTSRADAIAVIPSMDEVTHRYIGKTMQISIPVIVIAKNLIYGSPTGDDKHAIVVSYITEERIDPDDTRVYHSAHEFEYTCKAGTP